MDFQSVYECLLDVFPQVDSRLLRAVAIENHKDADSAVGIVLTEILPQLSKLSQTVSMSYYQDDVRNGAASPSISEDSPLVDVTSAETDNPTEVLTSTQNSIWPTIPLYDVTSSAGTDENSTEDLTPTQKNILPTSSTPEKHGLGELSIEGNKEQKNLVRPVKWVAMSNGASSSGLKAAGDDDDQTYYVKFPDDEKLDTSSVGCAADEDLKSTDHSNDSSFIDSKTRSESPVSSFCEVEDNEISENIDSEEVIVLEKAKGKCVAESNQSYAEFFSLNESQDDMVKDDQEQNSLIVHDILLNIIYDINKCGNNDLVGSFEAIDYVKCGNNDLVVSSEAIDCDKHVSVESPKSLSIPVFASVQEHPLDEVNPSFYGDENELMNIDVTRSTQICDVELLEEIIEDSRNTKKNLVLAVETIMNKIKEVEQQENAAEKAKEEVAEAGLDTLKKVKELKQMLSHAKEANDMQAGEVYGEKSILATEVKELLTRVLSLSEERDKSMCMLAEMHEALDARYTEAVKLVQAFGKEKLEREESAQSLLVEQEDIMEKVVQESITLGQEAEENSKLRDFLIERGRVVDTLQGELSVLCKDVRLLKDKSENRITLSEFLSSSSSVKTIASDLKKSVSSTSVKSIAPDLKKSASSKEASPAQSLYGHSPKSSQSASVVGESLENRLFEDEKTKNVHKAFSDDGWELFGDGWY
ncbi:hypothetical protein ACFE04_012722 [Oxalis oulophora]